MLWVSDSPVPRWPPCADVLDSAVRHLVFIYIYDDDAPNQEVKRLDDTATRPKKVKEFDSSVGTPSVASRERSLGSSLLQVCDWLSALCQTVVRACVCVFMRAETSSKD